MFQTQVYFPYMYASCASCCVTRSDVTLVVDGTGIPAHRVILCARSPYFDAMFAHKMSESLEGVVGIEGVALPVFRRLLRFMYTGTCELSHTDANMTMALLAAADRFQVTELTEFCSEQLAESISVANAAERLLLADGVHASSLKQRVLTFVSADSKRRAEVMETEAFKKLSLSLLHELLEAVTPEASTSRKRPRDGNIERLSRVCFTLEQNSATRRPTPGPPSWTPADGRRRMRCLCDVSAVAQRSVSF